MNLVPQSQLARIIILAVAAVAIGVFVYEEYPRPVSNYSVGRPFVGQEKDLFTFPPVGASLAEQKAHYDLVMQSAVVTNSVMLNNCVANPEVIKMSDGAALKITNKGDTTTQFNTSGKRAVIAAGQTISMPLLFNVKSLSIFTFGCGNPLATHPMGLLVVTPK